MKITKCAWIQERGRWKFVMEGDISVTDLALRENRDYKRVRRNDWTVEFYWHQKWHQLHSVGSEVRYNHITLEEAIRRVAALSRCDTSPRYRIRRIL